MRDFFRSYIYKITRLSAAQQISLIFLTVLAILIPVFTLSSLFGLHLFKPRADEPTTPPTPPTSATAIPFTVVPVSIAPIATNTPIPTASANTQPVISTQSLQGGKVGLGYSDFISGRDNDTNDVLNMTIGNLPPGISRTVCNTYIDKFNRRLLNCYIQGVPTLPGTWYVLVDLEDNHGGKTSKSLKLTIRR